MLPSPHTIEHASIGGWYVTVRMEIDCGFCEKHIGKYTLYVQPWRNLGSSPESEEDVKSEAGR